MPFDYSPRGAPVAGAPRHKAVFREIDVAREEMDSGFEFATQSLVYRALLRKCFS